MKRRKMREYANPILFSFLILCVLCLLISPLAFRKVIKDSLQASMENRNKRFYDTFVSEEKRKVQREVTKQILFIGELEREPSFRHISTQDKQDYFLDHLDRYSFGKDDTGFIFIIDDRGMIYGERSLPGSVGEPMDSYSLDSGTSLGHLVREQIAVGGGFIEYAARGLKGRQKTKISYVGYDRDWGWTIGAGFFVEELATPLAEEYGVWSRDIGVLVAALRYRMGILIGIVVCIFLLVIFFIRILVKKNQVIDSELERYYGALDDALCVMVTNEKGMITRVNHNYEMSCGYRKKDLLGNPFYHNFHRERKTEQIEAVRAAMLSGRRWKGVLKCENLGGRSFWLETHISPLNSKKNEIVGYLAVAHDNTELHEKRKELERASAVDMLTGLGNRFRLLRDLDEKPDSFIACFNLDDFASINRLFGFPTGDELLISLAESLQKSLDGNRETLYRLSGDTFVIRGCGGKRDMFVKRNVERLENLNPVSIERGSLHCSASLRVGIAVCDQDQLLMADSAMEAAKSDSSGYRIIRNGDIERNLPLMKQVRLLNMLKAALIGDRLFLSYQPILNVKTGVVEKYECLLRVLDEKGESLSPEELIDVAKKGRLYKRITLFVIDEVARACRSSGREFSLNFTLEDFLDEETVAYLKKKIAKAGLADRIILEVVETEELVEYDNLEIVISELKGLGFRIAIDDFGSGFSNFTYLLRLNIDFIKIDGSLIKNILTDEKSESLVSSIVLFARESGFLTVAEYIENEAIMDKISALGIDYAQGYHIGKPSPTFLSVLSESQRD